MTEQKPRAKGIIQRVNPFTLQWDDIAEIDNPDEWDDPDYLDTELPFPVPFSGLGNVGTAYLAAFEQEYPDDQFRITYPEQETNGDHQP